MLLYPRIHNLSWESIDSTRNLRQEIPAKTRVLCCPLSVFHCAHLPSPKRRTRRRSRSDVYLARQLQPAGHLLRPIVVKRGGEESRGRRRVNRIDDERLSSVRPFALSSSSSSLGGGRRSTRWSFLMKRLNDWGTREGARDRTQLIGENETAAAQRPVKEGRS